MVLLCRILGNPFLFSSNKELFDLCFHSFSRLTKRGQRLLQLHSSQFTWKGPLLADSLRLQSHLSSIIHSSFASWVHNRNRTFDCPCSLATVFFLWPKIDQRSPPLICTFTSYFISSRYSTILEIQALIFYRRLWTYSYFFTLLSYL